MLKIGVFSKLSRISIRMLRHYDERGLLVPKAIDSSTGYRYYSEEQLLTAGKIVALRDMGFGLCDMEAFLHTSQDVDTLEQLLQAKQAEIQAELQSANQRLILLQSTLNRLRKEEKAMGYSVTVKEIPQRYVASVRQIIPTYEQEGMLWGTMMEETASLHLQDADPCYTCAIFHDDGHKDADVDVEVQKTVVGTYPNTAHVVFKTEPAIVVASATYKGSYEQIGPVNEAVASWVQENGYVFDGMCFNIYHVSPHETQNPDEFVTEVCYSVKKK